jgi:hypothetical protein
VELIKDIIDNFSAETTVHKILWRNPPAKEI